MWRKVTPVWFMQKCMRKFVYSQISDFYVGPDPLGSYHVLISHVRVNVELLFKIRACWRKWKQQGYTWARVWLSGHGVVLSLSRSVRLCPWQQQKLIQTKIPSKTMIQNRMSVEKLDSNIRHSALERLVCALKWMMLLFPTTEMSLSTQFMFIWNDRISRMIGRGEAKISANMAGNLWFNWVDRMSGMISRCVYSETSTSRRIRINEMEYSCFIVRVRLSLESAWADHWLDAVWRSSAPA